MANPTELFIPINLPVLLPNGKMDPTWWNFFLSFAQGISTIDLATEVSGLLSPTHGGTGVNNSSRTLTISGFGLTLTQTGATSVTVPTTGTLISSTRFQAKRVTTGSIAGSGTGITTVTWDTPFADTSYSAVASILDTTAAVASLSVVHIESQTAGAISVRINNAAVGSLTGTVMAMAFHD